MEKKNPYPFTSASNFLPLSLNIPVIVTFLDPYIPYICPDHETNNDDTGICPICIFIEFPQYK